MRKLLTLLILASSLTLAVGCSDDKVSLENLGSTDDFSDLEIEKDFEAPEDEEKEDEIIPEPPEEEEGHEEETSDSLINTFYIEQQDFALARGPAKRWDGCTKGFKSSGGYNSDVRCGRAFLDEKFGRGLNRAFYKCSFNAAREAGYPKIDRMFINHLGSYNDRTARNSSRLSNHAYARALDIKNFNLVDTNGKTYKVSTLLREYKGSQAIFYDSFRQCWMDTMPSNCRPGQTEYQGSIGHKSSKLGGNSLHNDHIHLAFPSCAG